MAAPASVDEFLDLVKKSGVADEKRLDACLAKMRAAMPADAGKAAQILIQDGILTNFQSDNILAGKWRRFSIGKYKVLERLGTGGFAQVYLCEHKLMRRRVAVKVLPIAKTKGSSALARFHREARAAAELDHPNIVHAYDIDQDDDLHFFVMEYIDGANLYDIVQKSGPLSPLRASHYIRQAAHALQHAHEHNLVHRDIKPSNLLVDRTGVVKLLDLGLALRLDDKEENLTKIHDDGTLGTADYLSPEQVMDSHEVDIRADIYSLGVTFYFLLTGRPPFEGMPIANKLLAHQTKEPRPISDFRQDVPAGLLTILAKMMAKKAEDRYATPGEVAEALAPYTQEPIAAPTEAELPNLSPLAAGQLPGETETAAGRGDTSMASKAPVDPVRAPPITPVTTRPVVAATPRAAPEDEPFATDEVSRPRKAAVASQKNPVVFIALIAAFVVIPLFVFAGLGVMAWIFWSTPPPAKAGPRKFEVSRDANRKGAYLSIQAAVRDAETDSVIELWDDTYEENVAIEQRADRRTSITIQAAPEKAVVWRSAGKDPKEPILDLRKAVDFKLKGKGITFDGTLAKNGPVSDLVRISFASPGLTIEDASFKNFARSAVFIVNGAGTEAKPIKLHGLSTETADPARAAVYFDANPNILATPVNDHIDIDGVFRGHDKAFQFRDAKVLGPNLRWPGR